MRELSLMADRQDAGPDCLERVREMLLPGETVAGAFQVSVAGRDDIWLLAVTSRRLLFCGRVVAWIAHRDVTEVSSAHGHAAADTLALPNELTVKTASRAVRIYLHGEDDAAQAANARRARDLVVACRAQDALLARLL